MLPQMHHASQCFTHYGSTNLVCPPPIQCTSQHYTLLISYQLTSISWPCLSAEGWGPASGHTAGLAVFAFSLDWGRPGKGGNRQSGKSLDSGEIWQPKSQQIKEWILISQVLEFSDWGNSTRVWFSQKIVMVWLWGNCATILLVVCL